MRNELEQIDGVDVILFADAKAFDTWLKDNFQRQAGVWIKMAKKGSGIPSITMDETVDVGLCWGWISGQRRPMDETYYLQKYVPRRKKSIWSQVNVDKIAMLTKSGRMQPQGIAEVDAAKADGRWDAAYISQKNATPPPDLVKALEENKKAGEFFASLGKTDQYRVIFRLALMKTENGRREKLKMMVEMMGRGEKVG